VGRAKEGTEEIEKAHELDPLSPVITLNVGGAYAYDGRLDEAIAILDKLIEDEPTFTSGYLYRSYCFMLKGMKERAYADLEAFRRLDRDEDRYKWARTILYGWFGEGEKALPIIEELIQKVGKSSILETDIAGCYAILGDKDEFFNWIDRAISAKVITVVELRSSPLFDKVRDDPRFPEIFKKLDLSY
jgi:tetratricopeptide (TPR) repeat protein